MGGGTDSSLNEGKVRDYSLSTITHSLPPVETALF
jgi:hypothetical protein